MELRNFLLRSSFSSGVRAGAAAVFDAEVDDTGDGTSPDIGFIDGTPGGAESVTEVCCTCCGWVCGNDWDCG